MTKNKTILSILITGVIVSSVAQANENKMNLVYSSGAKDAMMIFDKTLGNNDVLDEKKEYLKGFITYRDASNLTSVQIIKYSAIATKLGYDVKYCKLKGKDSILFSLKDRMPDAKDVAKRLQRHNIVTNVAEIAKEVKIIPLVAKSTFVKFKNYVINTSKEKNEKIQTLEKYIRELESKNKSYKILQKPQETKCTQYKQAKPTIRKIVKKYVKLDTRNLQVVNRVLTERYIHKKHIKNISKIEPLNNYAKRNMTIEVVKKRNRIVAKNIKANKGRRIPSFKNFSQIYKYITKNAVINKNGILIINGRVFNEGDKISGNWYLAKAIYRNGVVIVKNKNSDFHIPTKK